MIAFMNTTAQVLRNKTKIKPAALSTDWLPQLIPVRGVPTYTPSAGGPVNRVSKQVILALVLILS
jgi:hypothetical protein